ncbi:MAG TPA: hypothetical protein VMI73_18510 [Trebonia sp.]|nr:hypothetical protein [Trebonia sp.]
MTVIVTITSLGLAAVAAIPVWWGAQQRRKAKAREAAAAERAAESQAALSEQMRAVRGINWYGHRWKDG